MQIEKGQLVLYYNSDLDELFIVKRGPIFGYWLLETSFGTSLFKTYDELEKSTTILNNSVLLDDEF